MVPWNKGLTKEVSPSLARVAASKAIWWASDDRIATRKKIGVKSKGRIKGLAAHPSWKGGRTICKRDGYVTIRVQAGTPGAKRSNGASVSWCMFEHRFVMQQWLGRALLPEENVHHRNGKKDDNRIENLMLVLHNKHFEGVICPYCKREFFIQ